MNHAFLVSALAITAHLALALAGKIDADQAVTTSTVIIAAYVIAGGLKNR